ncbi:unnamed protein product [Periconia digitata]|uniref:Uncharacterized protein n=1 Tax=Periconia digitata TaxID=1303443 RepID=A0A9W4UGI6_9PLEO|nr:unnamed protein product [Periconia digitata]
MSVVKDPKPVSGSSPTPQLTNILETLNQNLRQSLQSLQSLGSPIQESLHNDSALPHPNDIKHAAETVDLLHKIRVILDPPTLILADHFLGYVQTKCLCAAVERGIPDTLENGPMTLEQLATRTNSQSDRLKQIMHTLIHNGIFRFDESSQSYSNSPASLLLHSKHWTQWHNWVSLYGNQFYDIARGIPKSIEHGQKRWAAQINYNTDDSMFEYFRRSGWLPQLHKTLGGGASAQMPGILEDYPWEEVADEIVMDVGGGGGGFLAGLLRKYPSMQGGLFDLPHVIEHARQSFEDGGQYSDLRNQVSDNNLVAGDFFESVPKCRVYTMKWCLHDWKDAQAISILSNIRKSIIAGPKSRLIVLESLCSENHSERLSLYGDINMMMTTNGQERTEGEYRMLADSSGWEIEKVYDLRRAWVKALVFRPVS